MDYRAAARQIVKGQVMPIYVCYGTESYLMQEFIQYAVDHLIDPEHRDFAVSKYDLAETSLDTILDDAETFPFMVPRKLIIAKDATFFTAAKDSSKIEHRVERLLTYMKSPVEYSVIIFIVSAEKLDERKKLVKTLKEGGAIVPFPRYSADELIQWIGRQGEKAQITFDKGAVDQLIVSCGTDLQMLNQEISKLALFAGASGVVTADTVNHLVVRSTEQNIFMLVEEIVQLRLDSAFTIFRELLKQREEPIKILMLIARQFRIIQQVKELSRQGRLQQEMATLLGLHPYAVKIAMEQSRKYEPGKLANILSQLSDLDYNMKSGKVDKVLGMELFLLKLAG